MHKVIKFLVRSLIHGVNSTFVNFMWSTFGLLKGYLLSPLHGPIHSLADRVSEGYEVKYTTENPIQLPTTPIAEYELMNINGRNSYFDPKKSS